MIAGNATSILTSISGFLLASLSSPAPSRSLSTPPAVQTLATAANCGYMLTLLDLPVEIRLQVYDIYLALHRVVHHNQQPSNRHIRTLQTCKKIYHEASSIFCRYISLATERQIRAFLSCIGVIEPSQVLWADVANDGRFLHTGKVGIQTPDWICILKLRTCN